MVKEFCAACWALLFAASWAAQSPPAAELPSDFKSNAMAHVRQLAACGIHEAGTRSGRCAARYVSDQMKKVGLRVVTEPFVFHCFSLQNAVLEAGSAEA